eukprot:jgi/Mesvir1/26961/Mv20679-RA.1
MLFKLWPPLRAKNFVLSAVLGHALGRRRAGLDLNIPAMASLATVAAAPAAISAVCPPCTLACSQNKSTFIARPAFAESVTSVRLPASRRHTALAAQAVARGPERDVEYEDKWNKTYYPKAADHVNLEKEWVIFDAEGQILGRLAAEIASFLRGKRSPGFTPSVDMGTYVVVINAAKVKVTGAKYDDKMYYTYESQRPGGGKREAYKNLIARIPERPLERAVRGMLPKNRLGRAWFTHLKVYEGAEHPHVAQNPRPVSL